MFTPFFILGILYFILNFMSSIIIIYKFFFKDTDIVEAKEIKPHKTKLEE